MNTTILDDICQSLYNVISHKMMENGAYFTVATGQTTALGEDVSRMFVSSDTSFGAPSGCIWQSCFKNWNYESGFGVASGVYVDGSFVPRSSSCSIDYINGRVFFTSPISTASVVQMAGTVKEFSFAMEESETYKNKTKFAQNDEMLAHPFAADPDSLYLPAILMEVNDWKEQDFELGGIHKLPPVVTLTILADNSKDVRGYASVISSLAWKAFPIRPASDGPKLNQLGDLMEEFSFAAWCKDSSRFCYVKDIDFNRLSLQTQTTQVAESDLCGGILTIQLEAVR